MIKSLNEHLDSLNYGWVSFIIELLIIILAISLVIFILVKHVRSRNILIAYLVIFALLAYL